jgi:hypothetical protein
MFKSSQKSFSREIKIRFFFIFAHANSVFNSLLKIREKKKLVSITIIILKKIIIKKKHITEKS